MVGKNSSGESSFEPDPKGRTMLESELKFLCVLRQQHIVDLHCLVSSGPQQEAFVSIDKVVDSLDNRLETWRTRCAPDIRDRLEVVHSLASVLQYLHGKCILYRNLDPSKVGFDESGCLKLFDFSVAKKAPDANGPFKLTAMIGSVPYMAPCVFQGEPYDQSADIYSFSMVAWETMTLEVPFSSDPIQFVSRVIERCERPPIPNDFPLLLRNILRFGWARTPTTRPPARIIFTALDHHLNGNSMNSPHTEYISCILMSNGTFMEFQLAA
jgi:serine/threonine-protein kinase